MTTEQKETIGGMMSLMFVLAVVGFFVWLIFAPHDVEVWECRNCGRSVRRSSVSLPKAPALVCNGCAEQKLVFDHIEGK